LFGNFHGLWLGEIECNTELVKVKVVNMLGATIYEGNISASGEFTKRINLNGFENGIYFIAIQTGDKTQVKKLRLIN